METGYFCDEKREYIIENMRPVRPLKNYLWNDTIFAELNQFCFGMSKCCIDKDFKPLGADFHGRRHKSLQFSFSHTGCGKTEEKQGFSSIYKHFDPKPLTLRYLFKI